MADLTQWIVVMSIIAVVGLAATIGVRAYMTGSTPAELLFKARPQPRIGVVEYAHVDGKRRLMLVRRDGVEHLILTGGPVDVVIETGIREHSAYAAETMAEGQNSAYSAVEIHRGRDAGYRHTLGGGTAASAGAGQGTTSAASLSAGTAEA